MCFLVAAASFNDDDAAFYNLWVSAVRTDNVSDERYYLSQGPIVRDRLGRYREKEFQRFADKLMS